MTQSLQSTTDDHPFAFVRSISSLAAMIVLLLPIAGWWIPGESLAAESGREAVYWCLASTLAAYVLFAERRPLASIGLRKPSWKSLAFGFAGGIVMVGGMAVIYLLVFPALGLSPTEPGLSAVQATPLWFRILLAARAAVFEELYFRGFMIERLTELTRIRWLAAAISLTVFTSMHLNYWGWAHLLIAGFGGLVLTGLYLWRRDLTTTMTAHFLTDLVGFLVG